MIRIAPPTISSVSGELSYRVAIAFPRGQKELWFKLDEEFSPMVSRSSDPALLALLLPAMCLGEDIHVEGRVSERLFYNLSRSVQAVLRTVHPSLSPIEITADELTSEKAPGRCVAAAFSGGIDSFCLLADHFYHRTVPGFTITHLLYNKVGAHGWGGETLFDQKFDRLARLTRDLGLPFIKINSNLESFYTDSPTLGFTQTHSIRNAVPALLLQNGTARFMYASGQSFENVALRPGAPMGYYESALLPMISTESLDLLSIGSEYTRVAKTLKVGGLPDSYSYLDVCVSDDAVSMNCGHCFKCQRTLLTLEIAGMIEKYSKIFDLEAYRIGRDRFVQEILASGESYAKEIIEFARNKGFTMSSSRPNE